jgi:hypothetical protein
VGCSYPVGASPRAPVPPDERLASRSGANSTCQPSKGRTKLEGARRQAASLRPALCNVVVNRIAAVVVRSKPTVCRRRKATILGAPWPVPRIPPGSESGAWLQRGSSGPWEHHLSPCTTPGGGDRVTKGPGMAWGLPPGHEPAGDTTNAVKQARYRGASDKRSAPRGAGGSRSGA